MTPYLLIDFGTTSTKSAVVDLDTGLFHHLERRGTLPTIEGPPHQHETSLSAIRDRFLEISTHYRSALQQSFLGIVLCSEMHGFAVVDERDDPVTNYIGWLDERSAHADSESTTFSAFTARMGANFKSITGMRPRPGFAMLNIIDLCRSDVLPSRFRVLSLPCWLSMASGDSRYRVHNSMLAGMGFYDIRSRTESEAMHTLVEEMGGRSVLLNELGREHEVAGFWHFCGEKIPIYIGVGDHQCALLGAGNKPAKTLSLNLGTGSQVSVIASDARNPEIETRPFFGTDQLKTITHIPAGRVLAEFIGFLEEVASAASEKNQGDYWNMLAHIDESNLELASLEFDLGIMKGTRRYAGGGSIRRIGPSELTLENFLRSLLHSFASQYVEVAHMFDPDYSIRTCILSGGVARNLPNFKGIMQHRLQRDVLPATPVDESLLGLRTIALIADGRTRDYLEAMGIFGRTCELAEEPKS